MADNFAFNFPPINEIGLSAQTAQQGLLDPYDVSGLHGSLVNLPNAERQGSIGALTLAPLVGGGGGASFIDGNPPGLWWFSSEDQSRVLQLQSNFFSYNWRRLGSPLENSNYPGFVPIAAEARGHLAEIVTWHRNRGRALPDPVGCELFYDDVIPLVVDGKRYPISSALNEITRVDAEEHPVTGWTYSWLEDVHGAEKGKSTLRIHIQSLAATNPAFETALPVLRINFTAAAAASTWDEVFAYYDIAHAYIRKRFLALISQELQATWNR